eukprot:3494744-Alexandrium_andersonii.AAC.1
MRAVGAGRALEGGTGGAIRGARGCPRREPGGERFGQQDCARPLGHGAARRGRTVSRRRRG